ncbi:hypothetical protein TSOC_013707, partial [Tetrabaena socialis]
PAAAGPGDNASTATPEVPPAVAEAEAARDVIATAHIDRLLLTATSVSAVNRITQGDYRQAGGGWGGCRAVVLLGDGLDSRPFRLPWPPGTALFLAAPLEVHAAAEVALKSEAAAAVAAGVVEAAGAAEAGPSGKGGKRPPGPRPPPGCLLRRVVVDLQGVGVGGGAGYTNSSASASSSAPASSPPSFGLAASLAAVGFRTDRLSVWGVQGLAGLGLSYEAPPRSAVWSVDAPKAAPGKVAKPKPASKPKPGTVKPNPKPKAKSAATSKHNADGKPSAGSHAKPTKALAVDKKPNQAAADKCSPWMSLMLTTTVDSDTQASGSQRRQPGQDIGRAGASRLMAPAYPHHITSADEGRRNTQGSTRSSAEARPESSAGSGRRPSPSPRHSSV